MREAKVIHDFALLFIGIFIGFLLRKDPPKGLTQADVDAATAAAIEQANPLNNRNGYGILVRVQGSPDNFNIQVSATEGISREAGAQVLRDAADIVNPTAQRSLN
jgi:hypothetical protein